MSALREKAHQRDYHIGTGDYDIIKLYLKIQKNNNNYYISRASNNLLLRYNVYGSTRTYRPFHNGNHLYETPVTKSRKHCYTERTFNRIIVLLLAWVTMLRNVQQVGFTGAKTEIYFLH